MTNPDPSRAITLVAIIRARPGFEDEVAAALDAVAGWVARNEPRTLAYHVSQGTEDRTLFTTFERFADRAAMDAHNGSSAVAAFVAAAAGKLDGDIALHVGEERSAIARQTLPIPGPGAGVG